MVAQELFTVSLDPTPHECWDDENSDEFLDRLASEGSTMNPGAWDGTGKAEAARAAVRRSRESFGR